HDERFAWWGETGGVRAKTTAEAAAQIHAILRNFHEPVPQLRHEVVASYDHVEEDLTRLRKLKDSLETIPENARSKFVSQFLMGMPDFTEALEQMLIEFPPSDFKNLPRQIAHRDLAPIHLAFKGDQPVLVIDWENANVDTRVIDF